MSATPISSESRYRDRDHNSDKMTRLNMMRHHNITEKTKTKQAKMEDFSNDTLLVALDGLEKVMAKVNLEIMIKDLEKYRLPAAAKLSMQNADMIAGLTVLKPDPREDEHSERTHNQSI